jgi:uncharacterized protein YbjT (DUF2867 family)
MSIRTVITGATGMVGEGVLHICLQHPAVEKVLVINRRPCGVSHPKLTEIVHQDFHDLRPIESQLTAYNACFFCLGVSSIGLSEEAYRHMTYDLTMNFARTLLQRNPEMVFCYVSGAGTDTSEKGRSMWARVKGKTENHLMQLPFKKVYAFRPGVIEPIAGMKNTLKLYTYLGWILPILRVVSPNLVCTLKDIGNAMIKAVGKGYEKRILEVRDIAKLASR